MFKLTETIRCNPIKNQFWPKYDILTEIVRGIAQFFWQGTRWLAFLTLWGTFVGILGLLSSAMGLGFDARIQLGQAVFDSSTSDGFALITLIFLWTGGLALGLLWRDRLLRKRSGMAR